jgi:uncharacterized membrane protein
MEQSVTVDIDAPPARVWEVVADVERWPEWTPSFTTLHLLDPPLRVGSRAVAEQPRLPRTTWTVTELGEGAGFTWEARSPGLRTVGEHRVELLDDGRTRATLTITQQGWLGALMGLVYRGLTERYLALEAEGLKARAEGRR